MNINQLLTPAPGCCCCVDWVWCLSYCQSWCYQRRAIRSFGDNLQSSVICRTPIVDPRRYSPQCQSSPRPIPLQPTSFLSISPCIYSKQSHCEHHHPTDPLYSLAFAHDFLSSTSLFKRGLLELGEYSSSQLVNHSLLFTSEDFSGIRSGHGVAGSADWYTYITAITGPAEQRSSTACRTFRRLLTDR